MCSCAHFVYLAHLLGLAAGLMLIRELVRIGAPSQFLWLATGVSAVIMAGFLFHLSNPETVFFDFNKAYWQAGHAVLDGPDALGDVLKAGAFGFVNLPIVAYLFAPFGLMEPLAAGVIFTLLGIAAIAVAWRLLGEAARLGAGERAILLFLFAAFGPLIYSLREGNTSHIVLALVVWAFLLLRGGKEVAAGAVLGIAALIKLPLLLFGVYYVLRGRRQVVAGGASVIAGASILSLAVFGWDMHVMWFETCIVPYSRDPIPALNVQSIAGALARLELGSGSVLDWTRHSLSWASQLVASGSTLLILALAVASALAPRPKSADTKPRDVADEVEFLIVLMIACVVSPLTWSHYYAWMLMPAAFFIGRTAHFASGSIVRVLGWTAIVLAAPPVTFWQPDVPLLAELHARIGVSHLLYGGLVMLGLLIWSRWKLRPVGASEPNAQVRADVSPARAA